MIGRIFKLPDGFRRKTVGSKKHDCSDSENIAKLNQQITMNPGNSALYAIRAEYHRKAGDTENYDKDIGRYNELKYGHNTFSETKGERILYELVSLLDDLADMAQYRKLVPISKELQDSCRLNSQEDFKKAAQKIIATDPDISIKVFCSYDPQWETLQHARPWREVKFDPKVAYSWHKIWGDQAKEALRFYQAGFRDPKTAFEDYKWLQINEKQQGSDARRKIYSAPDIPIEDLLIRRKSKSFREGAKKDRVAEIVPQTNNKSFLNIKEENEFLNIIHDKKGQKFMAWQKGDSLSGFKIHECFKKRTPICFWILTPKNNRLTFIPPHSFVDGWNHPDDPEAWHCPDGTQDWRVGKFVYAGTMQVKVIAKHIYPTLHYWVEGLGSSSCNKIYTVFPYRGHFEGKLHEVPNGKGEIDPHLPRITANMTRNDWIIYSIKEHNRKRK